MRLLFHILYILLLLSLRRYSTNNVPYMYVYMFKDSNP